MAILTRCFGIYKIARKHFLWSLIFDMWGFLSKDYNIYFTALWYNRQWLHNCVPFFVVVGVTVYTYFLAIHYIKYSVRFPYVYVVQEFIWYLHKVWESQVLLMIQVSLEITLEFELLVKVYLSHVLKFFM